MQNRKCPYCNNEMKKGNIYVASNVVPYWLEDSDKRGVIDSIGGKGAIPFKTTLTKHQIESCYCSTCKKIILDADLQS